MRSNHVVDYGPLQAQTCVKPDGGQYSPRTPLSLLTRRIPLNLSTVARGICDRMKVWIAAGTCMSVPRSRATLVLRFRTM